MKGEASDRLFALLRSQQIAFERREHRAVYTVDEAERLVPSLPGAKAKSLFLRDRGSERRWLVVVPFHKRVDLARLGTLLEAHKLSFASPAALQESLAVEPGSVSPLALIADTAQRVQPVFDQAIWDAEAIQCHPLVNTATLVLTLEGLRRFLGATGHVARVLDVPQKSV